MNIQAMMKQAQKLQGDMLKTKAEIDAKIFQGSYSLVELSMNGKKEVVSLKLSRDLGIAEEDLELLEDSIIVAINETMKNIDVETEQKMAKYGSGLNGLL